MQEHFSKVAPAYNEIRTTDSEPIGYIRDRLGGTDRLTGLDVGTGAGRYALLFLREIPGLRLTCIDRNPRMLVEAAQVLAPLGPQRFDLVCSDSGSLPVTAATSDCVLTFNAVHHFDLAAFFRSARRALKKDGWLFVYTRLREQNEQTVWGRHFPEFAAREDRLYSIGELQGALDGGGFAVDAVESFRFERQETRERLIAQATSGHYSTFSLYSDAAFGRALAEFQANLESGFEDQDDIRWTDENIMFVARAR
jgi:SAM-dependent methyltransferase